MQKATHTKRESSFALKLLGFFCLITSIAVAPNLLYDPINSPKSFILIFFGFLITMLWFFKSKKYSLKAAKTGKFFTLLCLFYLLALLAPIFWVRDLSITRQILGDFGRLNGFGSSFALFLAMLFSLDAARRNDTLGAFFYWFKVGGYATLFYSILQILQLDPLQWSGPGTIGFLGNLNFNSAFLGLFSIYCLWNLATYSGLSHKTWWATLLILNLLIIYQSGSLQGLIVFGVGAISLLRMFSSEGQSGFYSRTRLRKAIQSIGALGIFLGLLGTLNIGPLNFLTQQTMLFRLDYWSAGIRMFLSYPWTGVGLDSYGRYYREFRDETAAYRTSPDRITNVSHNVFIDQFVSGGIFLGVTFMLFFLYALLKVTLSIRWIESGQGKDKAVPTEVLLLRALLLGYIFQLLVSINQIGLAIWGWALLGLTIGTCLRVKVSHDSASSQSDEKHRTLKPWAIRSAELVAICLGIFSLLAITNYVKGDFEFRKAYQARDYSTMWNIVEQHRLQPFFGEIALKFAGDAGDYEFISTKSKILIKIDERNYFAWLAQIALPDSTAIERQNAVEELGNLDPFNPEARDLFGGVAGSSPSN